jgi:hypothetical protein
LNEAPVQQPALATGNTQSILTGLWNVSNRINKIAKIAGNAKIENLKFVLH